jgi:hypothetical protein
LELPGGGHHDEHVRPHIFTGRLPPRDLRGVYEVRGIILSMSGFDRRCPAAKSAVTAAARRAYRHLTRTWGDRMIPVA